MKTGIGLPVFPGVSIGPAVVYRKSERTLPVSSGDPAVEQAKFNAAVETAREQLSALFEKASLIRVLALFGLSAVPVSTITRSVERKKHNRYAMIASAENTPAITVKVSPSSIVWPPAFVL